MYDSVAWLSLVLGGFLVWSLVSQVFARKREREREEELESLKERLDEGMSYDIRLNGIEEDYRKESREDLHLKMEALMAIKEHLDDQMLEKICEESYRMECDEGMEIDPRKLN